MRAFLNTDGGSRGNPGCAGLGFVLAAEDGSVLCDGGWYIPRATNNIAEYSAFIWGMENALALGVTELFARADSELMVKQMLGTYKVRNAQIKPLYERARTLFGRFAHAEIAHVYREKNKEADLMANRAMDAAASVGSFVRAWGTDEASGAQGATTASKAVVAAAPTTATTATTAAASVSAQSANSIKEVRVGTQESMFPSETIDLFNNTAASAGVPAESAAAPAECASVNAVAPAECAPANAAAPAECAPANADAPAESASVSATAPAECAPANADAPAESRIPHSPLYEGSGKLSGNAFLDDGGVYELTVKDHFDAAHALPGYDGPCRYLHGHTWDVEVTLVGRSLDSAGILYDFKAIKRDIHAILDNFDHKCINDVAPFDAISPTAEHMARVIYCELEKTLPEGISLKEVGVWESPLARVVYRR